MNLTEAALRRKVAHWERRLHPGVNPLLTREVWDAFVMQAAFEVLNERMRTAENDEAAERRFGLIPGPTRQISANDVILAARAELSRSYDGLPATGEW